MKKKRVLVLLWGAILALVLCGWEDFNSDYGNYSLDPGPNENYNFQNPGQGKEKNRISCKNRNASGNLRFYLYDCCGNLLDSIEVEPGEYNPKTDYLKIPAGYSQNEVIVGVAYKNADGQWVEFDEWSFPYPESLPPPK